MDLKPIPARHELVLLSHRLPIVPGADAGRGADWRDPIDCARGDLRTVATRRAAWIGRYGPADAANAPFQLDRVHAYPVHLSRKDSDEFDQHCEQTLAPLYHDRIGPPAFHRAHAEAYRRVNHCFARTAATVAAAGGFGWILGPALQLVPEQLRRQRPDLMIGLLLPGPFPPAELFCQLPDRAEMLTGALGADLVGFEHPRARQCFLDLAEDLLGLPVHDGVVTVEDRRVRTGVFPSAIDCTAVEKLVADPESRRRADEIRSRLNDPTTVVLAVGRLEPSSGILQRLDAYAALLADGRLDPSQTVLVEVAAPSGGLDTLHHGPLRAQIDRRVGQINGDYATLGRPVVHYIQREVGRDERVALYLAADVFVETPLTTSPALPIQEFLVARGDGSGRVVIGERVSLASVAHAVSVVNPYDVDAMAAAMLTAVGEARTGSREICDLRAHVRNHDIDHQAGGFLHQLGACVADDVGAHALAPSADVTAR